MNTGPLRGVVHHVHPQRKWLEKAKPRAFGFDLVNRRNRGKLAGWSPGHCVWCLRPGGGPRGGAYHPECKRVKDLLALGPWLPGPGVCVKCGRGEASEWPRRREFGRIIRATKLEVEHRVALSIAAEMLGYEGWVRAMMPGNLQWMCAECHKAKTAEDRATLAALRRAKDYRPTGQGTLF